MALVTVVGFAVGFRIHGGVPAYLLAVALVLLFAFALSWVVATVGLGAPNSEAAQAAIFPLVFPLTFASSAFVDTSFMPGWLQAFAEHQPVSVTADAARDLALGQPVGGGVIASVAWSLAILAVFVPLAVRRYRRMV
jgi:ABC-2 type transport system permease protein